MDYEVWIPTYIALAKEEIDSKGSYTPRYFFLAGDMNVIDIVWEETDINLRDRAEELHPSAVLYIADHKKKCQLTLVYMHRDGSSHEVRIPYGIDTTGHIWWRAEQHIRTPASEGFIFFGDGDEEMAVSA